MWPVDHRFMSFFPNRKEQRAVNPEHRPDTDTLPIVKDITVGNQPVFVKVKEITTDLAKASATNSILESYQRPRTAPRHAERNKVVCVRLPAQLLTVGEAVAQKKALNYAIAKKTRWSRNLRRMKWKGRRRRRKGRLEEAG